MAKNKIIIGIHGLGNKPPEVLLEDWWRLAIREGLSGIGAERDFNFRLVYWADILNEKPLDPDETDKDSDYFIKEKYIPADHNNSKPQEESVLQKLSDKFNDLIFNKKLHENFPSVTDWVIKNFFSELDIYLNEKTDLENGIAIPVKEVINERLKFELKQHRGESIMIIAHSMGSIIAYDVLTGMENEIEIDTLITIGSPLGVPYIVEKIKSDELKKLKTPEAVKKLWLNLADPEDKLAVNYELNKIFSPNSSGVSPKGMLIKNNYEINGDANPHKSFGYLRTPELSYAVKDFTEPERNKLAKWLKDKLYYFKSFLGNK